jgi:UDP-2,3-diacylglucosamine hydrolase
MTGDRTPVGLLAGAGRFPIVFAEKARELGLPVVCVGVKDMADPVLAALCPEFHWLKRASLGFIARKFRRGGVRRWTMAGKYHKHVLFQPWKWLRLFPDWRLLRAWMAHNRRDNKDDSLLLALIAEFRKDDLECVSALDLCPELLVRDGVLTRRKPTDREMTDVRFGWTLAKEMGRLDVGQSVMIRDRACIAVEAIEGTDKCIERAGELCGRAAFTVVKVAKPQQDMRFDVPTVGPQTIRTMTKAGATVLAIEAGKTILLDEAEMVALADKAGIAVVALPDAAPVG